MSKRGRLILAAIIAAGLVIRIVFAIGTVGVRYDLESYRITSDLLLSVRLHVYEAVVSRSIETGETALRWPYPPGLFPWLLIVAALRRLPGVPLFALLKVPMIVADLLIAIALALFGGRFVSERGRLQAAALVAFGPSFFLISSYHGQIDSVAILPGLLALLVWGRASPRQRALIAGAFVGIGIAIKTVPVALLGALVPQARSRLEAMRTIAAAAAVPGILLAPFLLATPGATATALRYIGAPGLGGLSLALQPNLPEGWLLGRDIRLMPWTEFLWDWAGAVVLAVLLGLTLLFLVRRVEPADAAVLIWLGIYALAPTFFFQYLVWGIPFFLLAGHLRWTGLLQIVATAPTLITILRPWEQSWVLWVYVPLMIALWVGFVVAFVVLIRRVYLRPRTPAWAH